jgi:hypothetical protein
MTSLLTIEEKELLMKVSGDKELVRDIEDALTEVKEGKTRPFLELVKELGLEGQVQA